jgi:hypothetical protein
VYSYSQKVLSTNIRVARSPTLFGLVLIENNNGQARIDNAECLAQSWA